MAGSIQAAIKAASEILERADVPNAKREASLLLAHFIAGDIRLLYREPDRQLTTGQYQEFSRLIKRRAVREPLSHLTGHREFWSLDFLVSGDVLDPRPDSETLIEVVQEYYKKGFEPRRLLDLGTGSGCLLLTLLSEMKGATGVGVDASETALAIAQKNATRLSLETRAEFRRGSWGKELEEKFDLVISNPPYIPSNEINNLQPEVRDFEPMLALDGGEDGLDCYRDILKCIQNILRPGGLLVFEVGAGQAQDVGQLMLDNGFNALQYRRDIGAIERCVSAFFAE